MQKKNLIDTSDEDLWKLDKLFLPSVPSGAAGTAPATGAANGSAGSVKVAATVTEPRPEEPKTAVAEKSENPGETAEGGAPGVSAPKGRSRRVGISILHPKNPESAEPKASVSKEPSGAERVLEQQALSVAWMKYASSESSSVNLSRTMQSVTPKVKDGNRFEVSVSNRFQEAELNNEWVAGLKTYVERETQCRDVRMEIMLEELSDMENQEAIMTASDVFEEERRNNAVLQILAMLLDLESE